VPEERVCRQQLEPLPLIRISVHSKVGSERDRRGERIGKVPWSMPFQSFRQPWRSFNLSSWPADLSDLTLSFWPLDLPCWQLKLPLGRSHAFRTRIDDGTRGGRFNCRSGDDDLGSLEIPRRCPDVKTPQQLGALSWKDRCASSRTFLPTISTRRLGILSG
jgi:hypothetical protein